ncbi:MAG: domain containing protein, partial [Acidobacteria bacterium]|nr:domain containing protein [Acidobacteriota bacterium]
MNCRVATYCLIGIVTLGAASDAFAIAVGNRIKAASGGANVRPSNLGTPLFLQDGGVHGTVSGGPIVGTAGGFSGNWWQINWDSQPPSQGSNQGWCAESVLSLVTGSGDIARPGLTGGSYTTPNIYWQSGNAPASTNPPSPQLGSALGNCTWYAHGRLRELGYNTTQLNAMTGDASA